MSRVSLAILGCLIFAISTTSSQAEETKGPKVLCPVAGQPVNEDITVDYKGGKVTFCCNGCAGSFRKDATKFAAKANHQLVVTKQARLVKCPFSGGKLNPETAIEVSGAKVCFCCNHCKGKAEAAEDKIALLFNDTAFAKGFEVQKPE